MTGPDRRPVQPLGDRPRWRIVYDALAGVAPGAVLSYEEMGQLLNLDFLDAKDRQIIGMSARRAAAELEPERKVFRVVRGLGYQLAQPNQVLELARRHQARAVVEVEAGRAKIEAVDLDQVDVTTARLIQATAIGFARQAMMMRELDVRQERLESTMAAVSATATAAMTRVDATQDTVEQLRQRVAELEATQHRPGTPIIEARRPTSRR